SNQNGCTRSQKLPLTVAHPVTLEVTINVVIIHSSRFIFHLPRLLASLGFLTGDLRVASLLALMARKYPPSNKCQSTQDVGPDLAYDCFDHVSTHKLSGKCPSISSVSTSRAASPFVMAP